MNEDAIRVTAGRPGTGAGSETRGGSRLPVPTELIALGVTVLAILIAAAVADNFESPLAWGFITVLASAYILSRGLTKRGVGNDGL